MSDCVISAAAATSSRPRPAPAGAGETALSPGSRLPGGLVYVDRRMPGLQRVRRGQDFGYRQPDGTWLQEAQEIARIRSLAIPPAYTCVWICPLPNGHLQATGMDARGRRQYRYHPDWRQLRDADKFERMRAFGQALSRIRTRVERDLAPRRGQPLARTRVLAAIVRLLDTTYVRVGNEEYAVSNRSYGLTTLRTRHAGRAAQRLRRASESTPPAARTMHISPPRTFAPGMARCRHWNSPDWRASSRRMCRRLARARFWWRWRASWGTPRRCAKNRMCTRPYWRWVNAWRQTRAQACSASGSALVAPRRRVA